MQPLFLDSHKPRFEKLAMPVRLSESPEAWQRDIAGEIYKQLPYLGEYAVNVILDRVDAQRGYGFGSAMISNRTDAPMPDRSEMPTARIPIVIRDYLMAPLDIFMDGAGVYPLTESRIREKLFRSDTFELSTRKPSDKGLVDNLYPPMRSNYGMGTMGGDTMGMGKMAGIPKGMQGVDNEYTEARRTAHNMGQLNKPEFAKARQAGFSAMHEMPAGSRWSKALLHARVEHGSKAKDVARGILNKTANEAEAGRKAMIASTKADAARNPGEYVGKTASLIEAIAPTLSEKDADQLVDQITNDMSLKVAASRNQAFAKLAMVIAAAPKTDVVKTAEALVESIKPNVVQFEKLASGNFKVKWANAQAFAPQQDVVPPAQANQMAGGDLSGMKPGATVTLSSEKAEKQSLEEPVYVKVTQYGKYEVQDMDSNQKHVGWVIPIVDLENHPLEMYVFVKPECGPTGSGEAMAPQAPPMSDGGMGGAPGAPQPDPQTAMAAPNTVKQAEMTGPGEPCVWAVQDEIAGLSFGGDPEEAYSMLVEGNQGMPPQGSGFFYFDAGKCCLLPMTIQNGTGDGFMGETMFGEPVQLQMVQGLQRVEVMGEGVYGIPASATWIPLPGEPVFLAKDPLDIENVAEAQGMPNQVQVGSTGPGEFSMEGAPLAKVARDQKQFIKKAEAEFLLVAMGVNPFDARDILTKAEAGHLVKCAGRPIVSLASLHAEMTKKAAKDLADFPYHLRQNLVKEASVIDDADTTDKVLSMNFINPENISTFAKYLPDLDKASQKLAELLLAVRLGIGSVDEGAVERAMKGMESVIEGLKLLQQKATA